MAATLQIKSATIEKATQAVINVRSNKPNAMRKLIPIVALLLHPYW